MDTMWRLLSLSVACAVIFVGQAIALMVVSVIWLFDPNRGSDAQRAFAICCLVSSIMSILTTPFSVISVVLAELATEMKAIVFVAPERTMSTVVFVWGCVYFNDDGLLSKTTMLARAAVISPLLQLAVTLVVVLLMRCVGARRIDVMEVGALP